MNDAARFAHLILCRQAGVISFKPAGLPVFPTYGCRSFFTFRTRIDRAHSNFTKIRVTDIADPRVGTGMTNLFQSWRWLSARRRVDSILIWAVLAGPLIAAVEPAKRIFDVPADSAEKSLKLFSRQAKLEVIFPPKIAKDVRTNSVRGKFTPREALAAMLDKTGLVLFEDRTGAFTIRREDEDPNGQRAARFTVGARPLQ